MYVFILYSVLTLSLREDKNRSLIHWKKVTTVALCFFLPIIIFLFWPWNKTSPYIKKMLFLKNHFITKSSINKHTKSRKLFLENLNKIQSLFIMYITYNAFVLKYFLHIHVCHSVVFTYPDITTQETREQKKWDVFQERRLKKSKRFYKKVLPLCFSSFFTIRMFILWLGIRNINDSCSSLNGTQAQVQTHNQGFN